jgi:CheY-like chemotaxis protein
LRSQSARSELAYNDLLKLQAREELHALKTEFDGSVAGKKVLIVDDDVRNIFAIRTLLENHQIKVLHADNGLDGIAMIERNPDIDVVLMDIMMPELDGYETIRMIRNDPNKRWLPVIAVTAKALKEDRDRCLEAGASDYLAKPVNEHQLIELLRVWTGQKQAHLPA